MCRSQVSLAPVLCWREVFRSAATLTLSLILPAAVSAAEVARPVEQPPAIQLRPPSNLPSGTGGPVPSAVGADHGSLLSIETPGASSSAPVVSTADFVLSAVVIHGASIFSDRDLEPACHDYLGRRIGPAEIAKIVEAITAKYRAAGFFLSHAVALKKPLAGGVLDVRVIEGYIEQVTVEGGSPLANDATSRYAAAVTAERPLRLATLERVVLLLKDLPGITSTPSVTPIDENAGRYRLAVDVTPQPVSGSVGIDNRGPTYEGPWESYANVSVASLALPYDELTGSFFTVPDEPRELIAGGLAYSAPLGSDGLRGALAVARSSIHPGDFLAPAELRGITDTYSASLRYPLLRSRAQSLWLSASFDVVDSREDIPIANFFDDHLRVLRADATDLFTDPWDGNWRAFVQISQGLPGLGASSPGSFSASTPGGRADFTKLSASLTHERPLFDDFSIFFDLAGQKSWQPLLLSEQFSLGGARFGRGYDPAELVGDDALAGAVELRYGHGVAWDPLQAFQLYVFYDLGEVWNRDPANTIRRASLASAGGGVRLSFIKDIALSIEVARPLTLPLAPGFDKPIRVFGRVAKAF